MTTPGTPNRRDLNRDADRNDARDEPDRGDEVSLRDLFLVLLRGLPFILVLALACGALAYLLNAQRRPSYTAESTVLVTPPPIEIETEENLSFSPINEVSFQTYETLARSQPVLRSAVQQSGVAISPDQLLSLGTLRQLFGPQRIGDVAPLSVVHRVRNSDPERAALLADAWAQSTLEAVRDSLFSSLSPVDARTTRVVAQLEENVEEVEVRAQAFAARDNGPLLEAELEGLTRQLIGARERQGELDRTIAAARARINVLREQLDGAGSVPGGGALNPAFWNVLSAQETLDAARTDGRARPPFTPSAQLTRTFEAALAESDTLSALLEDSEGEFADLVRTLYTEAVRTLEDALTEQQRRNQQAAQAQAERALGIALLGFASAQVSPPPGVQESTQAGAPGTRTQDTLTLLSAAELRREEVALQGFIAERRGLSAELARYTESAAAIQRQLATLEQRRSGLERELENVQASYDDVAELQSSISYLTELAPTNARILNQASVPSSPTGPRRAFNTGLAATLGALAGLVLVFLRAAVRRPGTTPRKAHA